MARKVIAQTQAMGEIEIESVLDVEPKTAYVEMEAAPHLSGYLVRPLEKHHIWYPRINLQTSVQLKIRLILNLVCLSASGEA